MEERGWCPQQARRLCVTQHAHVAYFASLLQRRERSGIDYSLCSSLACTANNVKENAYVVRHTKDSCQCSLIGVDQKSLRTIIKQGRIPIIDIKTSKNNDVEVKLKAVKGRNEYVAISHVWADGLGNPSNALPRCQIERIQRQVAALPEVISDGTPLPHGKYTSEFTLLSTDGFPARTFWLDTLCIPTSPEDVDLRLKAINTMAAVYSSASHVLVLDHELQHLRLDSQSFMDTLAHILCCTCGARSWTSQEGALARKCFFQFANGALNPIGGGPTQALARAYEVGSFPSLEVFFRCAYWPIFCA